MNRYEYNEQDEHDEFNELRECIICGRKEINTLACAWCNSNFCETCASEVLTKKDDEKQKICDECYGEAVAESRTGD